MTARLEFNFKKGEYLVGERRRIFASRLKEHYEQGASIRELADQTGRAYSTVHRMLTESGAVLRSRGGAGITPKRRRENGKFAGGQ